MLGLEMVKWYVDSLARPASMSGTAAAVFAVIALVLIVVGLYGAWRYTMPRR